MATRTASGSQEEERKKRQALMSVAEMREERLKAQAQFKSRVQLNFLRARFQNARYTKAHRYALVGDAKRLRGRLRDGFPANERDPESGRTVLHCAAANGHSEVVTMLLREFPDVDIEARTIIGGDTALHLAVAESKRTAAYYLLHFGANPNPVNKSGHTPFCYVANRALAKLLYNNGGDILHTIPGSGGVDVLQYLSNWEARGVTEPDHDMLWYITKTAKETRQARFLTDIEELRERSGAEYARIRQYNQDMKVHRIRERAAVTMRDYLEWRHGVSKAEIRRRRHAEQMAKQMEQRRAKQQAADESRPGTAESGASTATPPTPMLQNLLMDGSAAPESPVLPGTPLLKQRTGNESNIARATASPLRNVTKGAARSGRATAPGRSASFDHNGSKSRALPRIGSR